MLRKSWRLQSAKNVSTSAVATQLDSVARNSVRPKGGSQAAGFELAQRRPHVNDATRECRREEHADGNELLLRRAPAPSESLCARSIKLLTRVMEPPSADAPNLSNHLLQTPQMLLNILSSSSFKAPRRNLSRLNLSFVRSQTSAKRQDGNRLPKAPQIGLYTKNSNH
uniref:Uncharacterized protein n=1 Tax=Panagrellus redivivus TaxID=6233 RepID=A0A7E4W2L4_PANRE